MAKFKAFLKRKDVEVSLKRYGIDALGAMAQGLFCTLLVGTILDTLGTQLGIGFLASPIVEINDVGYTIGKFASAMVGPAMAVAIGYALHAPAMVLFSLVPVGFATNAMGGAGGPLAVLVTACIAAEFGKAVQESRKEAVEQSAQLKEHIHNVMERSQAVGDEARNLANALTGYSKVQGDFGEMLLTDVLKNAGLVEGVHFFTQSVMTDEAGHEIKSEGGRTMIPDVMVLYPDDTTVIIDSKVSLNSYKEYINAEKVEDRVRLAKAHVESVRKHVDELKTKDYASYIPEGRRKVNYNLMFIPVEGAFRLMLEEDPMLWQVAKDNNVLIVSQMTLVIVLNMIQMAWKQANQEKNIAEVYKTAEELMSQLSGWMESYVSIGTFLSKAQNAYETSTKKLTESNQSVVKKIQKLERLGLSPKKSQAKIKPGARKTGPESIIPPELSETLTNE